jgi:hypothetical protein
MLPEGLNACPSVPRFALQFSKIATVEDTPPGNMVDVIG